MDSSAWLLTQKKNDEFSLVQCSKRAVPLMIVTLQKYVLERIYIWFYTSMWWCYNRNHFVVVMDNVCVAHKIASESRIIRIFLSLTHFLCLFPALSNSIAGKQHTINLSSLNVFRVLVLLPSSAVVRNVVSKSILFFFVVPEKMCFSVVAYTYFD